MKQVFKKYSLFLFLFFISIWLTLGSTSINEQLSFSQSVRQVFAVMQYLPFLLAILIKVVLDLKACKVTAFNVLYYIFAVYYVLLSILRFTTGAEVKESIYYSVVLFGSLSLYAMLADHPKALPLSDVRRNLLLLLGFMVIYKIVVTFVEGTIIGNPPINNLYSTSILILLLPFMVHEMQNENIWQQRMAWLFLTFSVMLVLVCSSRAIVFLSITVFGLTFLAHLGRKKVLQQMAAAALVAVFLTSALAVMEVGVVRYAITREFNVSLSFLDKLAETVAPAPAQPSETTENIPTIPPVSTENPEDIIGESVALQPDKAQLQLQRSDAMRTTLLKWGIEEAKKNLLFGTGDLYYTYDMGYKTMELTAHNFIIECIVTYGLLGTGLILLLLLSILIEIRFFYPSSIKKITLWINILLALFYFFALGMVQPSVFNTLVCPVFVLAMYYYGALLYPDAYEKQYKTIYVLTFRKELSDVAEQ